MTNNLRPVHPHARVSWFSSLLLCLFLISSGCGGGGGGSQSSPSPPPPDFTLTLNPSSVSIAAGGSATTSLLASAANGFSSQVSVQVTGVPSGVSISPANISLTPGTGQQITLSAQSGMAATTATITFTGTSGSLSHAAKLSVSVTMSGNGSGTPSTRTKYVRFDTATEYFLWLNSHWLIFHQATSRFFLTDPFSNSVKVFDSTTQQEITSIPVPGAYGIDQTPDGSTLYVGTLVGDVYTLDPVAMKVTHRYIASRIGPYGYGALIALPLADGSVALLGEPGGLPSVDGSSSFAIWNPTDNSIKIYGSLVYGLFNNLGVPTSPLCSTMGDIGGFALTTDRTAVLAGSITGDGTICELVPSTGQMLSDETGSPATMKITTSPDGRYIALAYSNAVTLYDQHTLAQVTQFSVAGDTSDAYNIVFSADSQTLFVSSPSIVYAYSIATHQQIGWFPNVVVQNSSGGLTVSPAANPTYEEEDDTGLLIGPMEEGLGFLDTTQMQTGPVGSQFANGYLNPATGPASGGTTTQWPLSNLAVGQPANVYFGRNAASSVSVASGTVSATSPPGNPGPVDVYLFMSDGGMQLLPEAFSYGPTILEVSPNTSTDDGGGTGVVYGYGFGPVTANAPIPTDLAVTVGGTAATVTGFNSNAYNLMAPPFQLQSVSYKIPAGAAGKADVTVTTSAGSATAKASLTYLPAAKRYPLPGSVLAQGVYDPLRNVYYFSDVNKIQVFSLAQGQWLTPIGIPAETTVAHRLWGISLSPDGSLLAVADMQTNDIYLLDPSNPTSVQTFPFTPPYSSGIVGHPAGVAVSDSGIIYIAAYMEGGTGIHSFYKLDTSTGTLTDYGISGPEFPGDPSLDINLRTVLSSDGTRDYFNDDGYVFDFDTATDTLFNASNDPSCCYGNDELSLSPNQTQFAATSYLYDSDLNAQSFFTQNDREVLDISYVYGQKFSSDGSLLFQPSTNGIDVFDGRLGKLLDRIALPFPLSSNYDALVSDGSDNVLVAITGVGDGIAVLDLTSLPEPAPLPYATARSSRFPMAAGRARLTGAASPSKRTGLAGHGSQPGKFGIRLIPHVVSHIFATPRAARPVRH